MIHQATLSDRPDFLRLWSEHMTEQEKDGSHMLGSTKNLYRSLESFESYTTGAVSGMCLLWETADKERVAIAMVGGFAGLDEWETNMGNIATFWGVYVQPSYRGQGICVKLFQKALEIGLEIGFDTVETYVRVNNPHGQRVAKAFGVQPYMQLHLISLRDPKVLNNDEAREALGREVTDG